MLEVEKNLCGSLGRGTPQKGKTLSIGAKFACS